jgi:hypothetical protein
MFDGRLPARARRQPVGKYFLTFMAVVIAACIIVFIFYGDISMIPKGIWPRMQKMDTGPVRVVGDRPGGAKRATGATLSEPEATQALRRSFSVKGECLAVINKGYHDGAYLFDASNRCKHKHLGRWKVDGKSGTVSAAGATAVPPRAP